MIKVAVLTLSDTRTKQNDISGDIIKEILEDKIFQLTAYDIVLDDVEEIKNKLTYFVDELQVDVILTTGGTGLGPRDVTPDATMAVIDKLVPGISELIRSEGLIITKRAILSRGIAGVRKNTLIVNLPGSPKGVRESLEVIIDIIPHALDMIAGKGH